MTEPSATGGANVAMPEPIVASPPPIAPAVERERVLLQMPVDIRSVALMLLTAIACLTVLKWASAFFVPLTVAIMVGYALTPIVDRLERWRVPRALAAGMLILGIIGGAGWGAYQLSDDAITLLETLPDAARKVRDTVTQQDDHKQGTLDKVQEAMSVLELAGEGKSKLIVPMSKGITKVEIIQPKFDLKQYMLTGTGSLLSGVGHFLSVAFLAFFLLVAGNTFRRKMVQVFGDSLKQKKLTVQAMNEISQQVQVYLLMQMATSVLAGVAVGIAFALLGVKYAAVWGVATAVLHMVPYVGSVIITSAAALSAFLQFGTPKMALTVALASLLIQGIIGNLIVPWLTSKTNRMNPVAVFVGLIAWGWLWGVWGLLLGVPIMLIIKAICDHMDNMSLVSALLGD